MGANKTQAVALLITLIAFTLLALAFAGGGVIVGILSLLLIVAGCYFFLKCKPLEDQI